jgi:hypothetical protein
MQVAVKQFKIVNDSCRYRAYISDVTKFSPHADISMSKRDHATRPFADVKRRKGSHGSQSYGFSEQTLNLLSSILLRDYYIITDGGILKQIVFKALFSAERPISELNLYSALGIILSQQTTSASYGNSQTKRGKRDTKRAFWTPPNKKPGR